MDLACKTESFPECLIPECLIPKCLMPDNSKVQSYSDYFDETWMNGQFRPRMWNIVVCLGSTVGIVAHSGPQTNRRELQETLIKHSK